MPSCSSDVLTCTNQLRAWAGVGGLSSNGSLNSAAQTCALRLQAEWPTFEHSKYPGGTWGENIAAGYGSQTAVFNGWKNSSGHYKNLVRSNFTKMGLGQAGNFWCQQFG